MFTDYDRDFPKVRHETEIEWTHWPGYLGACWNMIRGCSRVAVHGSSLSGCGDATGGGCYAERTAARFCGPGLSYEGLVRLTGHGPRWTNVVREIGNRVDEPLRRSKPRVWFVASMSDMFHDDVPDALRDRVVANMILASWHVYVNFTKRAEEQRRYLSDPATPARVRAVLAERIDQAIAESWWAPGTRAAAARCLSAFDAGELWPPPRAIWGVSCEHQQALDLRAPILAATPAWRRAWSLEPLLGRIRVPQSLGAFVDWVIVGGESGPRSRACIVDDVELIARDVAALEGERPGMFVKQFGANVRARNDAITDVWPDDTDVEDSPDGVREEWQGAEVRVRLRDSHGSDPAEWPAWARVRELPRGVDHLIAPRDRAYAARELEAALAREAA